MRDSAVYASFGSLTDLQQQAAAAQDPKTAPEQSPRFAVRVLMPSHKLKKFIRVRNTDPIWQVKARIIDHMAKGVPDIHNYGLFQEGADGRRGKFLDDMRCVADYPLVENSMLELRMKHRLGLQPGSKAYDKENTKKWQRKLMELIREGNVDEVRAKCTAGTDTNFLHDDGMTPLTLAVLLHGDTNRPLLMALLEQGSCLDFRTRHGSFADSYATVHAGATNALGTNFFTPLHVAAAENKQLAVQVLLQYGAPANLRDSGGVSPLMHAAAAGHTDVVRMLLMALTCGQLHATASLLQQQVDELDGQSRTPLYHACANGHDSTVRTLLEYGANPNALNSSGNSPLHVACTSPNSGAAHLEVARLLLQYGADRERRTRAGQNASNVALLSGNMHLCEFIKKFQQAADSVPLPFDRLVERDSALWQQMRRNVSAGQILTGTALFTVSIKSTTVPAGSGGSPAASQVSLPPVVINNSSGGSIGVGSTRARRAPPPSIPAEFRMSQAGDMPPTIQEVASPTATSASPSPADFTADSAVSGSVRGRRAPPPSIPVEFRMSHADTSSTPSLPSSPVVVSAGSSHALAGSSATLPRTSRNPPPPPPPAGGLPPPPPAPSHQSSSSMGSSGALPPPPPPSQMTPMGSGGFPLAGINSGPTMTMTMEQQQQQMMQMMQMMMSMQQQQQQQQPGGMMMLNPAMFGIQQPQLQQPQQSPDDVAARLYQVEEEKRRLQAEVERLRRQMSDHQ